MHTLRAENLIKRFKISEKQRKALGLAERSKLAVNGISFTAHSGEIFGLLGPNGAGKTTTMRMLSTLIKPDSGNVFYDDRDVVSEGTSIRSEFAFLTTDLKLDMKSTANDMFDFFADLYHISSSDAISRKEELFDTFGISSYADTKIAKLSQGMRQKVSIAISVIHKPNFVIFDEPTNGLDIIASREVRDYILKLKDEGKCVIVSTHLFDLVEKICDRAAMIVDGKIVKNDTLENLMDGSSLEDAFYGYYVKYKKGDK